MKHLKKAAGFTVVELLIVISVLLLIAGLAFGIFGNPLSKATTDSAVAKIVDDMRAVNDGINHYSAANNADPGTLAALVTGGQLKALPIAPDNAKDSAFTGTYVYSLETATDIGGSAANDVSVKLQGVTANVCDGINQKYAGITGATPTAVTAGKLVQCYKPAAGDTTVLVLALTK